MSENKHKKAQEEKHSNVKYAVVGALSVVLVAFLLVWNTGIIQRNAAAVTVDGEKYSAADVQYYLRSLMLQNGISSTSSLKSMTMNSTTGETMYDYLKSQAVERLVTCAALYAAVPGLYKEENKGGDVAQFRAGLTDNDIK